MDEERKDLEEEEREAEVEEQPDFEEYDADAAPLEEPYHQMSFPEEQPELFGDSAAEEGPPRKRSWKMRARALTLPLSRRRKRTAKWTKSSKSEVR